MASSKLKDVSDLELLQLFGDEERALFWKKAKEIHETRATEGWQVIEEIVAQKIEQTLTALTRPDAAIEKRYGSREACRGAHNAMSELLSALNEIQHKAAAIEKEVLDSSPQVGV